MAVEGKTFDDTVIASADLSAAQYKAISVAGAVAANNDAAIGLLQNKPESGEHAQVSIMGKMKGVAGGAISAGGRVKVTTSGFLVAVSSGDGSIGKCGVTAAASGDIFTLWADFIGAGTTI